MDPSHAVQSTSQALASMDPIQAEAARRHVSRVLVFLLLAVFVPVWKFAGLFLSCLRGGRSLMDNVRDVTVSDVAWVGAWWLLCCGAGLMAAVLCI